MDCDFVRIDLMQGLRGATRVREKPEARSSSNYICCHGAAYFLCSLLSCFLCAMALFLASTFRGPREMGLECVRSSFGGLWIFSSVPYWKKESYRLRPYVFQELGGCLVLVGSS